MRSKQHSNKLCFFYLLLINTQEEYVWLQKRWTELRSGGDCQIAESGLQ